jgi:hypothetical protein
LDLTATDADFASMNTLSIRYTSELAGTTYADDTAILRCRIFKSDGTTALACGAGTLADKFPFNLDAFQSGSWTGGGGTAPGYNKVASFPVIDTSATKTDWDGARIEITFIDTRTMANDAGRLALIDFQLEGTYTATPLPYAGIQVTRPAVRRAANW